MRIFGKEVSTAVLVTISLVVVAAAVGAYMWFKKDTDGDKEETTNAAVKDKKSANGVQKTTLAGIGDIYTMN